MQDLAFSIRVIATMLLKMHPIAFQLGPLTIRWYGVMAAAGFLLAIWTASRLANRAGLKADVVVNLGFMAMLAGIVGGRIFYVATNWHQFAGNPWEIIRIDHGGLVYYGGFIGAALAMLIYGYHKKLPIGAYADVIAPAVPLGHAMGRIGCFLNGCCFGKPTQLPWGVTFPLNSDIYRHQIREGVVAVNAAAPLPVHPTQLYEALGLLSLAALMLWWRRRGILAHWLMWAYAGLYGLLRFVVEVFRADEPRWIAGTFTNGQAVAVAMIIVVGITLLSRTSRKNRNQHSRGAQADQKKTQTSAA